jgi:hypothetical protein
MDNNKLVTIGQFDSPTQANLYLALLTDAGVEAVLAGEYANEVLPLNSFSPIRLQVAAHDEKQARKILSADFDEREFEREAAKKSMEKVL